VAAAAPARFDQIAIRVCVLRILVQILHVGVGWRAVEVEIIFFDVLAVIALRIGKTEQALFENWVLAVP
jgi:hypothetical protein